MTHSFLPRHVCFYKLNKHLKILGSGGSIGYAHGKGYGHDLSVDAMVPVWSNKNRYGESTINLGGGVSHHMGGFGGNHLMDKRVGINFVHRF